MIFMIILSARTRVRASRQRNPSHGSREGTWVASRVLSLNDLASSARTTKRPLEEARQRERDSPPGISGICAALHHSSTCAFRYVLLLQQKSHSPQRSRSCPILSFSRNTFDLAVPKPPLPLRVQASLWGWDPKTAAQVFFCSALHPIH